MSNAPPTPEEWAGWLATFREQYITAKGWSPKEAKEPIRDAWAVVRDGRVHVLTKDSQRSADAVPVLEMLTPGRWKVPIEILERLTGLVTKAMSSLLSPRFRDF